MNLNELQSKTILYDNTNYQEFIEDYTEEIDSLNPEDRFILFKELYITSKFGDEYIADLIQCEVEIYGITVAEIENIKNNIGFTDGQVMVYRGLNAYNSKIGSSFTLDKEKAIWFSKRFGGELNVIELKVKLNDIIFYDNSREEKEVFLTNEVIGWGELNS